MAEKEDLVARLLATENVKAFLTERNQVRNVDVYPNDIL